MSVGLWRKPCCERACVCTRCRPFTLCPRPGVTLRPPGRPARRGRGMVRPLCGAPRDGRSPVHFRPVSRRNPFCIRRGTFGEPSLSEEPSLFMIQYSRWLREILNRRRSGSPCQVPVNTLLITLAVSCLALLVVVWPKSLHKADRLKCPRWVVENTNNS